MAPLSFHRSSCVATLAACAWAPSRAWASTTVRGVAPEEQAAYAPAASFKCKDGVQVPYAAVNDNYCDCKDGSDEPGTGACSGLDGTLFHCPNVGSTPRLVYVSRVDDGICDCCDGSDEAGLAARLGKTSCTDRCVEEGEIERQTRAKQMEDLKQGLAKKAEIEAKAIADRAQWTAEVAKLQSELPGLEAQLEDAKKKHEEAKKVADAAAASSEATDTLRKELDQLRELVVAQQDMILALQEDVRKLQTGGVPQQPPQEAAPEQDASSTDKAPAEEKKVVSEYAKWMDGAGETPGAIDDKVHGSEDGDDGADPEGGDDDDAPPPTKLLSDISKPDNTKTEELPEKVAVTALEAAIRTNKDEARKLNKKLGFIVDGRLGYADLLGRCLEKADGQYTYKLCFFDDARQDHTSLGRWKGFVDGQKAATFEDGQMCPGGPARTLKVVFNCGEEAVHEISEPSRCSYEAQVSYPGACDAEDQAALEKPPTRHPRDEL